MTGRWRVERQACSVVAAGFDRPHCWVVTSPVRPDVPRRCKHFRSHAEAIAYATSLTRRPA